MQSKRATGLLYQRGLAVYSGEWQVHRRLLTAVVRCSSKSLASISQERTPVCRLLRAEHPALVTPPYSAARASARRGLLGGPCLWRKLTVNLHRAIGTPCHPTSLLHTSLCLGAKEEDKDETKDQQMGCGGKERGEEQAMSPGEKALRLIGWLGGFYSRKAVSRRIVWASLAPVSFPNMDHTPYLDLSTSRTDSGVICAGDKVLSRSAQRLYESCIDTVDYETFFKVCGLPDSFQSWFLIAHLHVWLCLVRLKMEGKDGKFVTRQVVSTFWDDVQQRMKVLGVHSSKVASRSLQELVHEFYGLILAYDEGLLRDDQTLASAVWRNLIHDKEQTDPTSLARMVEYIRQQVQHMDRLDSNRLLNNGSIELLSLS